ncbi:MAG: hypothetical protein MZV64_00515 [Ignavibacteriales bacterium]|nr:hypothetical protein [Ignavibacteriales bacterium]
MSRPGRLSPEDLPEVASNGFTPITRPEPVVQRLPATPGGAGDNRQDRPSRSSTGSCRMSKNILEAGAAPGGQRGVHSAARPR